MMCWNCQRRRNNWSNLHNILVEILNSKKTWLECISNWIESTSNARSSTRAFSSNEDSGSNVGIEVSRNKRAGKTPFNVMSCILNEGI